MPLNVVDVLKIKPLSNSRLVAGKKGLNREVTGIMVMEAPDIEIWGNHGQIILTSYFALKDLSLEEIKQFFIKANHIGISAIIIKVERLLQEIPNYFIEECDFYQLPLIRINKEIKYESIMLPVIETLMNHNKVLLDHYYEINKELTKFALGEPSVIDILKFLYSQIGKDATIKKNDTIVVESTNKLLDQYTLVNSINLPNTRFTNFHYHRHFANYKKFEPTETFSILVVDIPSLDGNKYQLMIHELNSMTSEYDFMTIENTVSFLQMELLKMYAIKQRNINYLNELINDLLYGRYQSEEELNDILNTLNLKKHDNYYLVVMKFYDLKAVNHEKWSITNSISKVLENKLKLIWKKFVYIVKKDKLIFLIASDDSDYKFKESFMKVIDVLKNLNPYKNILFNVAISEKSKVYQLTTANKQVNDILGLLRSTDLRKTVLGYRELGIFRIFIESENIDRIDHYIPEKLLTIEKKNPELIKTLDVFLKHNQNYTLTSEELFIHPKTAKYRIEKVIELADINFRNPEEMLHINVGLRLLELKKLLKKHK